MSMQQHNMPRKRSIKDWKRTTEFALPSGMTVTVKRPPLSAWIAEGRVPEHLFSQAAAASARGETPDAASFDFKELFAFALELTKAALVWPRIVEGADPESDDEIDAGQIPYEDVMSIMAWAMAGAPGVPVVTTTGEVSAEALGKFRQDGELHSVSGGGGEVRSVAVGEDGDS